MDSKLKHSLILGALFTAGFGTLLHFTYEWTGRNPVIGLFVPISESTWEHIKMLFFPMLLSSCYLYPAYRKIYPGILSGLLCGIFTGCILIPVLFYTYTGILGFHTLFLDILTFLASVSAAYCIALRLAGNSRTKSFTPFLFTVLVLLILAFLGFTHFPPDLGIFREP